MAADLDLPELHFAAGLPGFPDSRRFALLRWGGDDSPFSLLRSLDDEPIEFLVVHPAPFFPDYAPEVDDDTVERLDLTGADDAVVLVIVTVPDEVRHATANLAGPIVVNRHSREAAQAVLPGAEDRLRVPLRA